MGYTRKTEHPFDIGLHQSDKIAVEHRTDRKDNEQRDNGLPLRGGQRSEPDEHGHGRNLGNRSNKRGGFVGSPLIDIRNPGMEGEYRQFEKETAQDHGDGNKSGRAAHHLVESWQKLDKIGGAGEAKQVAHAKQHHPGGNHPEKDILDRGLHLHPQTRPVITHGHQKIEGVGREFQGDEHGEQLNTADQHEKTQGTQGQEQVIFGPDLIIDPFQLRAEQQNNRKPHGNDELDELREEINPVRLVKQSCPPGADRPDRPEH